MRISIRHALGIVWLLVLLAWCIGGIDTPGHGQDYKMDTLQVRQADVRISKKGNEYALFLIKDSATLNGVTFDVTTFASAFDVETINKVRDGVAPGPHRFIYTEGMYQGRRSLVILKLVE